MIDWLKDDDFVVVVVIALLSLEVYEYVQERKEGGMVVVKYKTS